MIDVDKLLSSKKFFTILVILVLVVIIYQPPLNKDEVKIISFKSGVTYLKKFPYVTISEPMQYKYAIEHRWCYDIIEYTTKNDGKHVVLPKVIEPGTYVINTTSRIIFGETDR